MRISLQVISYEHSHTKYVPISFDHDVDTCPLLGSPHISEGLAAFNRELYLCSLLNTNFSLGSSTLEVRFCDDLDVRSQAPIPLGHDFHDGAHCDDREEVSDPLSPLAVASSLEFSTVSDTQEGSLTVHDSSLPLAPLGELEEGDGFETNASSDDLCSTFVKSCDTLIEEHSFDEPFVVEFSDVTPLELIDPISDEPTPDLAPNPPILLYV